MDKHILTEFNGAANEDMRTQLRIDFLCKLVHAWLYTRDEINLILTSKIKVDKLTEQFLKGVNFKNIHLLINAVQTRLWEIICSPKQNKLASLKK
jgi:hypothetical protein